MSGTSVHAMRSERAKQDKEDSDGHGLHACTYALPVLQQRDLTYAWVGTTHGGEMERIGPEAGWNLAFFFFSMYVP
jgi:hypothetical protein